jgi:hypothetical protein
VSHARPVSELTNPWEPWQRLIDSIGSYYRGRLFKARDQAQAKLGELDEEELRSIASEGRRIAGSLDEEGARLTVSLTDDRERHAKLASELQHEAQRLARQAHRTLLPRRRRQARADAAELAAQAEHHRHLAAEAHDQLRELGNAGRHLYPWFERHEEVLGRGLAAEVVLEAAHSAVYHVLGAPGIASLTAMCLNSDRAIDLGAVRQLVEDRGDERQRLLVGVADELYGRNEEVTLSELLAELDGEDLDRVLQAIAMVKRRRLTTQDLPADLWIRAAEPEE